MSPFTTQAGSEGVVTISIIFCRHHTANHHQLYNKLLLYLFTGNKELPFKVITKESSSRPSDAAEGTLTLFIAEHCSTMSVDHLGELCSKCFKDSKATDGLKLHRTKCTEIMKNVLASHFRQELLDDIGNQKFSILLDESTDVSVSKHLGLVQQYPRKNSKLLFGADSYRNSRCTRHCKWFSSLFGESRVKY